MWTGWQREEHSGSRRKLWKLCGGRRGSELGWDVCGKQTALENKDERIQYELYCLLLLTFKTFRGINLNLLLHMLLHNSILFNVLFHKGIHTCCCGMAHRLKIPRWNNQSVLYFSNTLHWRLSNHIEAWSPALSIQRLPTPTNSFNRYIVMLLKYIRLD